MNKFKLHCSNYLIFFILILSSFSHLKSQIFYGYNLDTVKAQRFDMGKMWTFEDFPFDYFKEEYNFTPDKKWLEKLQKSALRLGSGCSASFVSEDGLIMTNHHCIRGILPSVQKDNENILKNGFLANSIDEERRINNLRVEQLLVIEDVTDRINNAIKSAQSDEEKLKLHLNEEEKIISEYQSKFDDLVFRITSLYDGGRFSLYGYKIYDDIRLVFVPELSVAKLGGDFDNFTYPRYGLDCAFLRAYDNGKPIKSNFFLKWSNEDVFENQLVFVIGNPGNTDRILTTEQIEFERDFRYPIMVEMLKDLYEVYKQMVDNSNAEDFKLIARLFTIGNSLKVFQGTYNALLDPILMARKKDFQNSFKSAILSDVNLKVKYGNIWDDISSIINQQKKYSKMIFSFNISNFYSPQYLIIANRLYDLIEEYDKGKINSEKFFNEAKKLYPEEIDYNLHNNLLKVQLNIWKRNIDPNSDIYKKVFFTDNNNELLDEILRKSYFSSKENYLKLIQKSPDEILRIDDPLLNFIKLSKPELLKYSEENRISTQKLNTLKQMLGEALYKVYGNTIPPDATFTLRIADGIVKGYHYNGTIAPIKTTFYGALDRYYSFEKKFPYNLPDYWEKLPAEFDLSTPLNFISTNDIVGGNSGSPVVNVNGDVIGLAFDGNIESLPNNFIYTTESNRTISVSAKGMFNAIKYIYKAHKLSEELLSGKRIDE